jgi:hypothetical protein
MKGFLREAVDWSSEALETACGWALYLAIAYAILFVDVTGRGNLWSNVASMWKEGTPPPAAIKHDGPVRLVKLGAEPENRDDGTGYARFHYDYLSDKAGSETVMVPVEEKPAEMTDAPADASPAAKQDWRRGINGKLRTFTVYGDGEQSTSASAGGAAPARAQQQQAQAYAAAAPDSAYRAGAGTASRPAIGTRARGLSSGGDDSVRNFRR